MGSALQTTLPTETVAEMVRILGEVAGMTTPLEARRTALMEKLLVLVGGDTWLWAHARIDPAVQDPVWFTLLEGGWRDQAERNLAVESINHPSMLRELFAKIDKSKHVSFTRQQFTPQAAWNSDDYRRNFSAATGVEDTAISFYPVSDKVISAIGISRRAGRPHFSSTEITIAHLVLGQIDWLHRAAADVPANNDELLDMPRRQREVLMHLLCGAPIKEVAKRLSISVHTVADYTKALYRRFDVSSRGELVRKFMSGAAVMGKLPDATPTDSGDRR